jgi:DeoR family lactose phosphotransferase system repressor
VSSPKRIHDRLALILQIVERQGVASYEALAEGLHVSTMTVRRDCDELAKSGKIIKTIGGIQQAHAPPSLYENAVRERIATNQDEKRAIAAKALSLIQNNQTVFLYGGTTNLFLAKLVADQRTGLTIVTNSALTCLESSKGQNTIVGIGGEYDPLTLSFVGPHAEEAAKTFFVDQAFFTTKAFRPTGGTFESAIGAFRIKQIIAERAVETVLLVDHTKFGRRALSKVLDISQIHHVVTDDFGGRTACPPKPFGAGGSPRAAADLAVLSRAGIKVHVGTTENAYVAAAAN